MLAEKGLILGLANLDTPANMRCCIQDGQITRMAGDVFPAASSTNLCHQLAKCIQMVPCLWPPNGTKKLAPPTAPDVMLTFNPGINFEVKQFWGGRKL